jgi:hypothetical protein
VQKPKGGFESGRLFRLLADNISLGMRFRDIEEYEDRKIPTNRKNKRRKSREEDQKKNAPGRIRTYSQQIMSLLL